ncbi:hypothetical protein [Streptomyces sp. NRRL S-87]|uniref:hypothetical protein n=1 Tax=Streptomyces sp. NRRL S-87 TaxID=1463920 RepID=UPI00068F8E62|nr:hypothetical protein [Streptomyces sp. NRRL S-87]
MPASTTAPVDLPTGWCATDLGPYRPCGSTYEVYPAEDLPALDPALLDGGFGWLGGPGDRASGHAGQLASLEAELAPLGLRLPADFRTFYGSARLCGAFDEVSVTACWSDLSRPLRSPVEDGARLVRFLRDQQDCVLWYLYLRPSGEAFVVCSPADLEYAEGLDGERAAAFRAAAADSLLRCAGTFQEFACRFVVENELWSYLHESDADGPLAPYLRDYLDRYAASAS